MRAFPGGSATTLFFCAALGCLLLTSWQPNAAMWWLGLSLLVMLAVANRPHGLVLGAGGVLLAAFGLFLLFDALVISPAYHFEAVYYAATFLIALPFALCCHDWLIRRGFRLFCAAVALIAAWAVLQWLTGSGFLDQPQARAQALFTTPNTLATLINLALAPLLAYYLLGRGSRLVYGLSLLLFAGLLATQSRGGYLGLGVAMLFFMGYVGKSTVSSNLQRYRAVLLGFAGVLLFFRAYAWLGLAQWSLDRVVATVVHGEHSGRFEIYGMAWPLWVTHFWRGIGYFNFGYYFEMHKPTLYLDGFTHFVHNDYLQLALETGVVGIALYLALVGALYHGVWRHRPRVLEEGCLPVLLPVVAMTSMLTHALVDFPFYIPVLIAVFSACAGVLDRQLVRLGGHAVRLPSLPQLRPYGLRSGFVGGLALLLALGWLGLPAAAETAAAYGLYRLRQGDAGGGLFWHRVARSLQPRDAVYYWREGIILRDLGSLEQDSTLIRQADVTFMQGMRVNPFDVDNVLAWLALQRQYRARLSLAASNEELLAWAAKAGRLRPHSDEVAMETIRVLDFVGRDQEAIARAKALIAKRPASKVARKLLNEVESRSR
ncbi:MAG: O-antigen ligase family protein [Methylophilaceae bacterium]|nr:O-antigen ligase family protein [Methylophilaceae bacterium]